MYESPIEMIVKDIQLKQEEGIFKAIQECKISVDREELLKALQYDREQYKKGYSDRDAEIVRCKDCVWYDERRPYANGNTLYECRNLERFFPPDFFCKDGERRDDADIH